MKYLVWSVVLIMPWICLAASLLGQRHEDTHEAKVAAQVILLAIHLDDSLPPEELKEKSEFVESYMRVRMGLDEQEKEDLLKVAKRYGKEMARLDKAFEKADEQGKVKLTKELEDLTAECRKPLFQGKAFEHLKKIQQEIAEQEGQ